MTLEVMGVYNQYLPAPEAYAPMGEPSGDAGPGGGMEKLLGQLKGLLKMLHLNKLDSGDLLLLLIVLLLWREEKDSDLLLAVGGALLLGEDDT